MRRTTIVLIVSYFLLSFLVLCVTFPIWQEFDNRIHVSGPRILSEFLLMSAIVTLMSLFAVPALTFWAKTMPLWVSVLSRIVLSVMLLTLLAWYMGPLGGPLGGLALIRGTFFSEWLFLSFIVQDATSLSLLAGVYYWWIARKGLKS